MAAGTGLLIVAFPSEKDVATEFAFEYWVQDGVAPTEPQEGEFDARFVPGGDYEIADK